MKRRRKWLVFALTVPALLAAGHIGLAIYYQDGFAANTWINGVYCTGRTVEEVNGLLMEQTSVPAKFTVVGYDGPGSLAKECEWTLETEKIHLTMDYSDQLQKFLAEQDPWMWLGNLTLHRDHDLEADIHIDEAALESWWEHIASAFEGREDYRVVYSEAEGYVLYDGLHNRLDAPKAYREIKNAILAGQGSVDLIELGCYYDVPPDEEERRQEVLWNKIESFQGRGPVYDFGEGAEPIDRAQMSLFLEKDELTRMPLEDENGHFILVEGCAADWVGRMAQRYDTYQKEWQFCSTRGEALTVKGVTYGTTINQKQENVWLSEYLENLVRPPQESENTAGAPDSDYEDVPGVEIHIPVYTRDAFNRSSTEIGDTYIEVDMGAQKLYYYKKGELKLETDIVTGNARRRMDTPEGVNFIYNKQKNRILRGQGYASPVKFWMPVKGAIGLHDATWRDEFGGDIYKTNGSHGCVNLPLEAMSRLYEMAEIGTPVIMFYGSDAYAEEKGGE